MWICNRCQTANKEGYSQCVECSAPRNARRFGAGRPVSAPSVQTASPERRMQNVEPAGQEAPPAPISRKPVAPPSPRRAAGGFIRLAGLLLAVLLPALAALLAVLRMDVLSPVIRGLFFGPEAPDPGLLGQMSYWLMALVAVLLALWPGLSLVALSRLMGLSRRGRG
ncbi:MAG: hypothetical protein GX540_08380 [Clostridiales bacterium]|nr:hypothetical protein [Clostridiales bacterium]